MANAGSPISAANVVNYGELIWMIREGQIKTFLYDPENADWVRAPLRPAVSQSPTGFGSGSIEVSNVSITNLPDVQVCSVTLKARSTNTGSVYIGGNNVSNVSGYELRAGDSLKVSIDNLNKIFVVGTSIGDRLDYAYEQI